MLGVWQENRTLQGPTRFMRPLRHGRRFGAVHMTATVPPNRAVTSPNRERHFNPRYVEWLENRVLELKDECDEMRERYERLAGSEAARRA